MRKDNSQEKQIWKNAMAELQLGNYCVIIALTFARN